MDVNADTFTKHQRPATIAEAGRQMRNGLLTSEVLIKYYLERIKTLNPKLNAFITITEELALETAATLDAELKSGNDRGPLHSAALKISTV